MIEVIFYAVEQLRAACRVLRWDNINHLGALN
jgi:hypothetical protein